MGFRRVRVWGAYLARLSEIHRSAEVLTLDSDFRIYCRHGNKVMPG